MTKYKYMKKKTCKDSPTIKELLIQKIYASETPAQSTISFPIFHVKFVNCYNKTQSIRKDDWLLNCTSRKVNCYTPYNSKLLICKLVALQWWLSHCYSYTSINIWIVFHSQKYGVLIHCSNHPWK